MRKANLPLPDTDDQSKLREAFLRAAPAAVGHAAATPPAPTSAAGPPIVLPNRPPVWVDGELTGEGVAQSAGSKLKTARAAETSADEALRILLDGLPLSPGLTLGEAAKRSPAIEKAIADAIGRARTSKVDYRPDGSVSVQATINPHELWAAISDRD